MVMRRSCMSEGSRVHGSQGGTQLCSRVYSLNSQNRCTPQVVLFYNSGDWILCDVAYVLLAEQILM